MYSVGEKQHVNGIANAYLIVRSNGRMELVFGRVDHKGPVEAVLSDRPISLYCQFAYSSIPKICDLPCCSPVEACRLDGKHCVALE